MATETTAIGRKRKSEEMLENSGTQGRAQKTESIYNEPDAKEQDVQGRAQETELDIDNKAVTKDQDAQVCAQEGEPVSREEAGAKDQDTQGRGQEVEAVDREEVDVKERDTPGGSQETDPTIDYDSDATAVMDISTVPFHKRTYDVRPPLTTKPRITSASSLAVNFNESDTEDELPQARSRHRNDPPAHTRTILPKPASPSSGWVPPVRGLFAPPLPPRGTFAPVRGSFAPVSAPVFAPVRYFTAPILKLPARDPVAVTAPVFPPPITGPVAVDAGGRPYPSPYNSYPTKRTILDYEGARARAGTSLVPTEQRGHNKRYTSVLEHDVAILTGRLARSNYEKTAAEEKVAEQAREIKSLRASVMALGSERDRSDARMQAYKEKVQRKMDAIIFFMLRFLETGTEVYMEMFEVPE